MVTHSHIWSQLLFPGLPTFFQNLIKKAIAWLYKKYDGIIFPMVFSKKDFDDCHLEIKEIVISNGVNTKIFHPKKNQTSSVFSALYVGRLDPEKHIDILIKAFHLLQKNNQLTKDMKCVIV